MKNFEITEFDNQHECKVAIGIQSTVERKEDISLQDWRLYLKTRSEAKVKLAKRLTNQLNQVLQQKMIAA